MSDEKERPEGSFRVALAQEQPLQIVGVINAYASIMAEKSGFRALYLSGSGVATASYGIPDLGITSLEDVLVDVRRITAVTKLPLLVDIDTGWGSAFGIARTIREMIRAGAAAVHMEDQVADKRCGHRPNKQLVSTEEMCDRIKAAVDARGSDPMVIMARTDACAVEGVESALARAVAYRDAGAEMIFAEAVTGIEDYRKFAKATSVPILANMTEFGKTEIYDREALGQAGASMVLYPLSAFRAMNAAAVQVFESIREQGHQREVQGCMQTRSELYNYLEYHNYEKKLDQLFSEGDEI